MLKIQLSLKQDVIDGFSYSFAKALLDRLNALNKEGVLWDRYPFGMPKQARVLTQNICHYLSIQIPYTDWTEVLTTHCFSGNEDTWKEVGGEIMKEKLEKIRSVIGDGYDFLSTFDKKS